MRDLFPGFYKRTDEELSRFWQEGIFVFDTNMFLNVYRYTPKTRDRYFEILDLLKRRNQIWIPYQAAYEYQDRRMDVIRGQLEPYTKVGSILQTTWQTLDSALEPYKSKHGFIDTTELAEQLISTIKAAKDTVTQSSGKYKQYKQENEALKKHDKLLEKIEELFQGNIGNPYTRSRLEELYRQAQLRMGLQIPPGWEDEGKNSFKAYGDIILWFQLIDYARSQKKPLVFVTDDGKKDWWVRDTKGKPIRPLPALVQEMFVEAGVLLHMYQGYEFLDQATDFLKLIPEPSISEDAKEVTERNALENETLAMMLINAKKSPRDREKELEPQVIDAIINFLNENSYYEKIIPYPSSPKFPNIGLTQSDGLKIGIKVKIEFDFKYVVREINYLVSYMNAYGGPRCQDSKTA